MNSNINETTNTTPNSAESAAPAASTAAQPNGKSGSKTVVGTILQTKTLAMLGVLAALAYAAVAIGRVPVVIFLSYDPKDIIIAIGGFLFGPLAALTVSVVVSFVEMFTISSTGIWGCIMNILSTCSFACTAAFIYSKKRTFFGAVIGIVAGIFMMTGIMCLWNYLITPIYMKVPRTVVVNMIPTVFLPFNALKASINAAFVMLLYKPLTKALRKANLLGGLPAEGPAPTKNLIIGGIIVSALVAVTGILLILIWRGII